MRSILFLEKLLEVATDKEDVEFLVMQLFELKKEVGADE